jgi:short-subunit dehydrogenase
MDQEKTILITGTSTGIGYATVLYLDNRGYRVFAGIRKLEDGNNLKKYSSEKLEPVILDVTNEDSVLSAKEQIVSKTGGRLDVLINNAGVALVGVLEAVPVSETKNLFDVNVFGVMTVTKTFLPLLRNSRGRIINIGSTSGMNALPLFSSYAASKYALNAISESLRFELKPLEVFVSQIIVGPVETEIWEKSEKRVEQQFKEIDPELNKSYQPVISAVRGGVKNIKKIPAIEVAKIIYKILNEKESRHLYLVGKDAKRNRFISRLPFYIKEWLIMNYVKKWGIKIE